MKRYIIAIVLLLLLFIFFRETAMFVFFVVLTGTIAYYSKLYHMPFDISPLFFFQIAVTRYYGPGYMLILVFFGYIIPKFAAGGGTNMISYVFILQSSLISLMTLLPPFAGMDLLTLGLITTVLQYIGGTLINLTMKPLMFSLLEGLATATNNLIYFLALSDVVVFLVSL